MSNPIYQGALLGDRYRIVRELGHGGFGRTYLAEDINRFNELCVLKEFAPRVRDPQSMQKAEELFAREAGTLYKLQHPQIPRFRELFRAKPGESAYLFLVQDYVEGQTYRALLASRKRQGMCFNESEIMQLLTQLLPVLEYVHSLGVVHRDISPDNLMLRHSDWLPVLIDFGGVKQVAATVESQLQTGAGEGAIPSTRLGKMGYAPDEQMQMGLVYPHSDLYALAATCLVLLTGKEPQQLIDPQTLQWNWQQQVKLTPRLSDVLDKMLAHRPGDRFPSARDVLFALTNNLSTIGSPLPSPPSTVGTVAVLPGSKGSVNPGVNARSQLGKVAVGWEKLWLALLIVAGAGGFGWWAGNAWIKTRKPPIVVTPAPTDEPTIFPTITPDPTDDREDFLGDRLQAVDINYNFFTRLVDEEFYFQNPDLAGRQLSDTPGDRVLRAQWQQIAVDYLDKLETLSPSARSQLGQYEIANIGRWKEKLDNYQISSRSLNDLTDGLFKYWFEFLPLSRYGDAKDFLNSRFGQVWMAIATDYAEAIAVGEAVERIEFPPKAFRHHVEGTLPAGAGKAFTADLDRGQILRVNLKASAPTLLSIYPPDRSQSPLLDDSPNVVFSKTLPVRGIYEFVVVNNAKEPISFRLDVAADNVR